MSEVLTDWRCESKTPESVTLPFYVHALRATPPSSRAWFLMVNKLCCKLYCNNTGRFSAMYNCYMCKHCRREKRFIESLCWHRCSSSCSGRLLRAAGDQRLDALSLLPDTAQSSDHIPHQVNNKVFEFLTERDALKGCRLKQAPDLSFCLVCHGVVSPRA